MTTRSPHVDDIAVERACHGDAVTLTARERAIAVARLTSRGMSARQIAGTLGMAARTVQRYRAGEVMYGRPVVHSLGTEAVDKVGITSTCADEDRPQGTVAA